LRRPTLLDWPGFGFQLQADGEQEQGHTGVGNNWQLIAAYDLKAVEHKSGDQISHQRR
jgi:hypothetical protein